MIKRMKETEASLHDTAAVAEVLKHCRRVDEELHKDPRFQQELGLAT
jgi:hypothetical protein